jgi:RNA polymerase sigma-70 factor (ECF subfamily)
MSLLNQLPPPQRSVLLLHFIEDFSLEQIAEITGAPTGTVKSRLHYAKRALRQILEDT